MITFKDAVKSDIKRVFINPKEFADIHEVNGEEVSLVVDTNLISEYRDTKANPISGVFLNTKVLYVHAEDLGYSPVEGEILTLDGIMHIVRSVSMEHGVLVITIEANEQ